MEVKELVGKHLLTGVDSYSKEETDKSSYSYGEDANCVSFILDGVTYTATEDPNDGYRSSMKSLEIDKYAVKNIFPEVEVFGKMKANEEYSVNDTIQFVNTKNGEVVLEVGTDNTDDYYPCFVGNFYPENLRPLNL